MSKGSFADEGIDLVAIEEALSVTDNIIVIVIVISVVKDFAFLFIVLLTRVFAWCLLLCSPFLLCIINLLKIKVLIQRRHRATINTLIE